jgi:hypothetical protein
VIAGVRLGCYLCAVGTIIDCLRCCSYYAAVGAGCVSQCKRTCREDSLNRDIGRYVKICSRILSRVVTPFDVVNSRVMLGCYRCTIGTIVNCLRCCSYDAAVGAGCVSQCKRNKTVEINFQISVIGV